MLHIFRQCDLTPTGLACHSTLEQAVPCNPVRLVLKNACTFGSARSGRSSTPMSRNYSTERNRSLLRKSAPRQCHLFRLRTANLGIPGNGDLLLPSGRASGCRQQGQSTKLQQAPPLPARCRDPLSVKLKVHGKGWGKRKHYPHSPFWDARNTNAQWTPSLSEHRLDSLGNSE
jgi:hypothetical protein